MLFGRLICGEWYVGNFVWIYNLLRFIYLWRDLRMVLGFDLYSVDFGWYDLFGD